MRRLLVLLIALALVGALCFAGFRAAQVLAPARLRSEIEGLLARETNGSVEIADLQITSALPPRLDGTGLRLYDGALTVERAQARIDLLSLLTGHPRLTRLELDGVELRLTQARDGTWKPQLGKPGEPPLRSEASLAPMRTIAGLARFLLAHPILADDLVVADGRLSLTASGAPAGKVSFRLDGLDGELHHSRMLGNASLELAGRWVEGRKDRGRLAWKGHRGLDGKIALTLQADALELSALAPGLRALVPGLEMRGRLDGVAEFEGVAPDRDRFAVAATAHDLEARAGGAGATEWLHVPSLAVNARLALDPDRLSLADGRLEFGAWKVSLDGSLARPFGRRAQAQGRIAIEGLPLDPQAAFALTGWLPDRVRERARGLVGRVREGRLLRGEIAAEAPLEQFGEALSGRVDALLPALQVSAELEGVELALEGASALQNLSGRLAWSDGMLEVHDARSLLDGKPLPVLDLRFRGLARLLASAEPERAMQSSAASLPGVAPLFEVFRTPGEEPSPPPPSVRLDLEHLYHRALLWPLREIRAEVLPREDGLHVAIGRALWAGVPVAGELDWTPQPERRIDVRLEVADEAAAPPADGAAPGEEALPAGAQPAAPADEGAWAIGRIEIGPSQGSFRERRTGARLRAQGGSVRFDDVRCELDPSGQIAGSLEIDLSRADAVPYALDAKLEGGDLGAILTHRGAKGEPMTGTLALGGKLAGTLVPGRPLLADASGSLELALREGTIPKTVPPVLALALASDSLNPFSSRERIRYSRADAVLGFASGTLETDAFEIEGPDLRMFASGKIDLREQPNPLRAEIALFLFRQLDWALVKIPILNELLLGENKNLVAVYFKLVGTWQEPEAKAQPLLTVKDTAGGDILEGIPRVVIQGVKAIGGLLMPAEPPAQGAPAPPQGAGEPPAQGAPAPPQGAGEPPAGS